MFILLIPLIFGVLGAAIASGKNRNALGWGLLCFLLPLLGLLILVFQRSLPSRTQELASVVAAVASAQGTHQAVPSVTYAATSADAEKWAALAKYDDDVQAAVAQLQPYGNAALDKLRSTYLALNDKAKLPAIVADLQAEFANRR